MRERAINRILNLTNAYSREELEAIKDTQELVALSYDVKKITNKLQYPLDNIINNKLCNQ